MARIGIDSRSALVGRKSGVETYVRMVAVDLPRSTDEHTFHLFVDSQVTAAEAASLDGANVRVIRVPTRNPRVYPVALRLLARALRLDLFHFPVGMLTSGFPCPTIANIHDLTFVARPELYHPVDLRNQHRALARARRATAVIAISENTKRDVLRAGGFDADRIHVTLLEPRPTLPVGGVRPPSRAPYVLCVGNIQPRKNFLGAVSAMAHMDGLHVCVAGKTQDETYRDAMIAEARRLGVGDRLHLLGYVTDDELAALYDGSELLLFPSLYEGFGYPIVEAFARGVPVVTSDASCMPEIAGDAAEYGDPRDAASIAAAVSRALARRDALIDAGRRRLAELTRVPLTERTLAVYQAVL